MSISYTTLSKEAAATVAAFKKNDYASVEEGIFTCGVEYLKNYAIQHHETKFYSYVSQMEKHVETIEQVDDVVYVHSTTKSKINDEVIAEHFPGVLFTKAGKKTVAESIQQKLADEELETF